MECSTSADSELLHAMCRSGNEDGVKDCLARGADVNDPCGYMRMGALHAAIGNSPFSTIQLLVNSGATVLIVDRFGMTPMCRSLWSDVNNTQRLRFLVEHLVTKTNAVNKDNVDVTYWRNMTLLHYACHANSAVATQQLLTIGANPNVADEGNATPLHISVYADHTDITKILMDGGASYAFACASNGPPTSFKESTLQSLQCLKSFFK